MHDEQITIAQLKRRIREFVAARDWQQFHSPKNLAMSLAIEAAELMEHFQWIGTEQSRQLREEPAKLADIADELADVLCYALAMGNELGIDLASAVERKMLKNEQKYPAAEYRGRYGPEDPGAS
ncbi:MAG: nucleotide pyrophosphohydrolase [Planctomycetota bacterium]